MKKQAFGYARVSTAGQVEEGMSLDVQADKIKQLCDLRGWELVEVYREEGVSGQGLPKRRQLEAAMKACCEAKGVLVFYDLSRLARNTQDALAVCDRLRQCGADLASCTEPFDSTATGRLMFEMMAAFAAYFARVSGEKIAASNARTVRKLGHRTQGRQPYGWKLVNGVRVECAEEQAVIAMARQLRRGASLATVALELNAMKCTTRDDAPWYATSVKRILDRRVKGPKSPAAPPT